MNIVDKLKSLAKERGDKAPFNTLQEFEVWADEIHPLLSFHKKFESDFSRSVTSATVSYRMGSKIDANTNMNNAIGIVNKALIAAQIERNDLKGKSQAMSSKRNSEKSIKERFEGHPVIWGLALISIGAIGGFKFSDVLNEHSLPQQITTPAKIEYKVKEVGCIVEGVKTLTQMHHTRLAALQAQLIKLESGATDHSIIISYRDNFKYSAERVRKDIVLENRLFKETIEQLDKKCTNA